MSAPPPAGDRPWQAAYSRYRELEQQLTHDPAGRGLLPLLHDAVEGRHVFDGRLTQYQVARRIPGRGGALPEPSPGLLDELGRLADLKSSYDREVAGFVFDDVYHLAFHRLMWWRRYGRPVPPAGECLRLYRGQRNSDWEVGAKIYRGLPVGPDREALLRERAAAACRTARAVAAKLGIPFADAMAVAQHYSEADVLGVPTWLVDFSRDPWVGLFFASDGGVTGETGVVWDIMPSEWTRHAAGPGNPLGPLQFVVPAGVVRIENQAGVFLVAGVPQLFDQYVAFGADTRFRQHTGVRFEDPVLDIRGDTIYPPNDPLRGVLAGLRGAADCGCGPGGGACDVPPAVLTHPFDAKTYENLLASWYEDSGIDRPGRPEPAELRPALTVLARFHALLHSPAYVSRLPSIVSRSLNRLRSAYEEMYFHQGGGRPVSVRDAVRATYVQQMLLDGDHAAVLMEALNAVAPR